MSPHPSIAVIAVLAICALGVARPAAAQFRWRGQSLPACRTFLITESSLSVGTEIALQGDIGAMRNVGPRSAVGGSLHGMLGGNIDESWGTAGVAVRYRRWLGRAWAFDVSPRVQWKVEEREWTGPSLGASAAIGVGDVIGLVAIVDGYADGDTEYSLGIRLGSYFGAPGALVLSAAGVSEASR